MIITLPGRKRIALFLALFILLLLHLNSTPFFRSYIANSYEKNKRYDQAIAIYKKILRKEEIGPSRKNTGLKDILNIKYKLAGLLLERGKYTESAIVLKKIADSGTGINEDHLHKTGGPDYYRSLGLAMFRAGLKEEGIAQFKKAIDESTQHLMGQYELALMYKDAGESNLAVQKFEDILNLSGERTGNAGKELPECYLADVYYNLAIDAEKNSSTEKAKKYYYKTIYLGGNRLAGAYLRLKDIYLKEENNGAVSDMEKALAGLTPAYGTAYRVNDKLLFLGYSFNEKEFELFNKGEMTFMWEADSNSTIRDKDFRRAGNRLYRIKEAVNLAPNFGFEKDEPGIGFPSEWNSDRYGAPLRHHEIAAREGPDNLKGQCLVLSASPVNPGTECRTKSISADKGAYYIYGAWIESDSDGAWLGIEYGPEYNYSYIFSNIVSASWKHFSGVVKIPYGADYFKLLVAFVPAVEKGKAYFDNVIFVKLDLPDNEDAKL